MGKTFDRGSRRPTREQGELTARPFKGAFKGMRVGPSCLKCNGPIDARPGWSLSNPRGSRKTQRHGYLHLDCELEAQGEVAKRQPDGKARMELPVYDSEEIREILKSKEVRS
jgi:hypothetical protein